MSEMLTPAPNAEPKTPIYKRRWVKYPAIALVAFTVGTVTSSAAKTETVQAPGETKTVVQTKTVEKTPDACKEAFEYADSAITVLGNTSGLASQSMQVFADVIQGIQDSNVDVINGGSERLKDITDKVNHNATRVSEEESKYNAAKQDCLQ